jgi:hypothetical protein
MPRRSASFNLGPLGLSQLLVIAALILTILELLNVGVRGLPLLPIAVLLLCIAWLAP